MRSNLPLLVASALMACSAWAEDGEAKAADWRTHARSEGLSDAEVDLLEKQKLLVAGPDYRQIFEPYDSSKVPTFVTADSVLTAYHVLLEESVVRLERARAGKLSGVLTPMWNGLPDAKKKFDLPEDLFDDVVRRAQITLGVALRLLGGETPGVSDKVSKLIDAEMSRVVAAKERLRPEWSGPADEGFPFVDYTRFAPRGFYVRDERLMAYFRAVSWLQEIPMRLSQERELFTAALLSEALDHGDARQHYRSFTAAWRGLLGFLGDIPLEMRVTESGRWTRANIGTWKRYCAASWEACNSPKEGPSVTADALHGIEPGLRVLPATILPDALIFDRWCEPKSPGTRRPSGLLVAAALGGAFARQQALRGCAPGDDKALAGLIDNSAAMTQGGGLYSRYLRCISALLDAPEPAAPPLFASEAWQSKSTNAALAGWAQLRHTWVLQARENKAYGGFDSVVAGFVEPDPTFFSRLADLVESSCDLMEAQGAFDEALSRHELLWLFQDYASFLREGGGDKTRRALESDMTKLGMVDRAEWFVGVLRGRRLRSGFEETLTPGAVMNSLETLDETVRVLRSSDPLPEKLALCMEANTPPFTRTWRNLERLCRRLEAMAHKQLRGAAWDEEEREVLLEFGHVLAAAMFYEGNSYLSPRDDAPRATSILADHRDPAATAYFQVGIARPRALYVLLPWKDGEVLCRGAVMPYREFSDSKRLTDAEWKELLDSKEAPPAPAWMAPIVSDERHRKPR
ncbi:MAG: DUF3160 domain-containing protein [Planctomycetota bacterium]